jgi:hypothetical protein
LINTDGSEERQDILTYPEAGAPFPVFLPQDIVAVVSAQLKANETIFLHPPVVVSSVMRPGRAWLR